MFPLRQLAAAISTLTVAQMSVEDQIETRQAAYQFASWNMGKIKAQTVDGSAAFDQNQVAAAAKAIAAVTAPMTGPRTPASSPASLRSR